MHIIKGYIVSKIIFTFLEGSRGRDRMIVGFTTAYAISAYQH